MVVRIVERSQLGGGGAQLIQTSVNNSAGQLKLSSQSQLRSLMYPERFLLLASALFFSIMLASTSIAEGLGKDTYRLRTNDTLSIKVGQWNSVESKFEEWSGLGGRHVIGPDGRISVAMAGYIVAGGRTTKEVSDEISRILQGEIGLANPPATSIEITEFSPIYVVGSVNTPGEFRYRTQMTAIQAIGLAGGHLRSNQGGEDAEQKRIVALRDYKVLQVRRWSLLVRQARLEAELHEKPKFVSPPELEFAPNAAQLLATESNMMQSRRKAAIAKLAAIEALRLLLNKKLKKVKKQIEISKKQLSSAREEMERTVALFEKGLTVKPRQLATEKFRNDLESRLISLEILDLTTAQQLNQTIKDKLRVVNERRQRILDNLRQTQERLAESDVRFRAAKELIDAAAAVVVGDPAKEKFTYLLRRRIGNEVTAATVNDGTILQPGDTLEVKISATESRNPSKQIAEKR